MPIEYRCEKVSVIMKIKTIITFIVFFVIITSLLSAKGEEEINLDGSYALYGTTDIKMGISFPPFSNKEQIEFTLAKMKDMAVDRIRIAIDWRNREHTKGSFYHTPMDLRMSEAKEHNISIFLTILSQGPSWATTKSAVDGANFFDEEAFTTFVTTIVSRYDNIDKIQFGNEWEAGNFDGNAYVDQESVKKFVTYTNIVYDVVKRVSPHTQVVLGGITRIYPMNEVFLQKGKYPNTSTLELKKGLTEESLLKKMRNSREYYEENRVKENIQYVLEHARYDLLDIHLYDDAENWASYLSVLPIDTPIVVSEFGGPSTEFENTHPSYHAKRMISYIDAIESLPITEAYYFKLVDSPASYHQHTGLFDRSLKAKPARNVLVNRLTPVK